MSAKSILVTGGAGYVGSHACKALHQSGFLPVTFDNLSTGHRRFVRWGPLIHGDIRDTTSVIETIGSHDVQAVLHFAASALVGESVNYPQKYYENNVAGSMSLLNAMRATECRKIVFSSTCAIYGDPTVLPIRETAPQNPVNPYGSSKAMVERMIADYSSAYRLNAIALRYFNAAGADPAGEVGELRDPETHLIPRAMMSIQGHVCDFTVFGSDYDTPDGTAVRDYVHVSDLAEAHVLALRRLLAEGPPGAFNLGTGRGLSVKQVLNAIAAETGGLLGVPSGARRHGDPPALVADASLGRSELGWEPRLSDITAIVRTAWNWHQQAHPKLRRPVSHQSDLRSKRLSLRHE